MALLKEPKETDERSFHASLQCLRTLPSWDIHVSVQWKENPFGFQLINVKKLFSEPHKGTEAFQRFFLKKKIIFEQKQINNEKHDFSFQVRVEVLNELMQFYYKLCVHVADISEKHNERRVQPACRGIICYLYFSPFLSIP